MSSIIFNQETRILLSHKTAIDCFYRQNTNRPTFSIKSTLFDINSPYLRESQPETKTPSKKREKIYQKKKRILIEQNPEVNDLVIRF